MKHNYLSNYTDSPSDIQFDSYENSFDVPTKNFGRIIKGCMYDARCSLARS